MKRYEQIDTSGDVGLRIWGDSMEELFENAAEGLSDLITDVSGIKEAEKKQVALNAEKNEDLLINWLNELIFLFDTYGFIGRRFVVNISPPLPSPAKGGKEGITLTSKISGGIFAPEVNESRLLIKAATYHNLSVKKVNSGWEAVVIFDI
ncbi:MAG: archease [Nitrospirae bacterium]|nr:archease [Nitrospirota bacterium]